jgi:hypothetical protein
MIFSDPLSREAKQKVSSLETNNLNDFFQFLVEESFLNELQSQESLYFPHNRDFSTVLK